MCDVIVQRLQKKKLLKRHHIYLLINPVSSPTAISLVEPLFDPGQSIFPTELNVILKNLYRKN